MTVMTGKLLIMFMEVHGLVDIWVVFFTLTICCRSIHMQVLQSNLHIIIFKIVHIAVICLFLALVHLSGRSMKMMLVVYSHVVVMYIVRLIMVITRMLNL